MAPLMVIFDPAFACAAGVFGGISGWGLGWLGAYGVDRLRLRIPLTAMACVAVVVGMGWGAAAGAFGGLFASAPFADGSGVALGMVLGGIAGGLQLGALFLPYLVTSTVGGPRWPVLGVAVLAAPLLGWGALSALFALSLLWPLGLVLVPTMLTLALHVEGSSVRAALGDRCGRTPPASVCG
jgi:hypothetical protein